MACAGVIGAAAAPGGATDRRAPPPPACRPAGRGRPSLRTGRVSTRRTAAKGRVLDLPACALRAKFICCELRTLTRRPRRPHERRGQSHGTKKSQGRRVLRLPPHGASGCIQTAALALVPAFSVRTAAVPSGESKRSVGAARGAVRVTRSGALPRYCRAYAIHGFGQLRLLRPLNRFCETARQMRAGRAKREASAPGLQAAVPVLLRVACSERPCTSRTERITLIYVCTYTTPTFSEYSPVMPPGLHSLRNAGHRFSKRAPPCQNDVHSKLTLSSTAQTFAHSDTKNNIAIPGPIKV